MGNDKIKIGKDSFISDRSSIRGEVEIGDRTSIFDFVSIRADLDRIVIGDDSNIQDNSTLHVDPGFPIIIGNEVSIGHNAVIHGCTIEDKCLIGMGSIIMNGAIIGSGTVIGAGTLILENQKIPENSLVVGVPGRIIKNSSIYREMAVQNAKAYGELRKKYIK
ncbi:gamma carbonic anhydrase family protein [Cuniculiplasma sp. SKW3]|uniref:gamma carbonic anhydrase family protein n=1 Tax=unclassified Cuniculiplasma TaxID=2619706 RepID=UPI003FCFCD06